MRQNELTRRDFLRLIGFSSGGLILSSCLPKAANLDPTTGSTLADIDPASTSDIEFNLRAVPDEVQILPGKTTQVWRYKAELVNGPADTITEIENSYLGPIFSVHRGDRLKVHFINELTESTIVHWHGLHVPVEADGHPRLAIDPGESYDYEFTVLDRAGTYWFHPHPHGRTGPQAYYGLAGLFLIKDETEAALGLPSGDQDIPLVIQDRLFDQDNQLVYGGNGMMNQMMGFLGNRVLVNGQPDHVLPVSTRPYRLRLHNGSNSRIYKIGWEDGTPITIIGTDGGLLETPIQKEYITLAPAQRAEVWIDLGDRSMGDLLRLVNLPSAAPGGGSIFPIMTFVIDKEESVVLPLPIELTPIAKWKLSDAKNARSPRDFTLSMGMGMGWTINGRTFEMTSTAKDEQVKLNDIEVWQFTNQAGGMGMMGGMGLPHPIHMHGLQYQIIEREIDPNWKKEWATLSDGFVDEGWHDTVLVMPGERVKIMMQFKDFEGLYLYHCHNLEHEDMGMMRNYLVKA